MVIKQFEQLFEEFKKLPKLSQSNPTYMEIAGYPHYENVCSNILSFYFDTQQPHKLGDLFLKSLLECLNFDLNKIAKLTTYDCIREYSTDEQKRIDLVIECEDMIIAIENKIFHWLHNDLNHYEKTINDSYFSKTKKFFVVLSIKTEKTKGSFCNVTYESFFTKLKQNLGNYAVNANNQYITYLLDFIKSIENHYTVEDINIEMFNFIVKNEEAINALNQESNNINNRLIDVVKKLLQQIEYTNEFHHQKWIWNKNTMVFDFKFDNKIVAVDITINKTTIFAELFLRGGRQTYDLLDSLQLIKNNPNKFSKSKRGYTLYTKDVNFFEINKDEFIPRIINLLELIKK
ncbi:PD-(D/E)XK nuclease family protein [Flavobacterium terrisoli]|uniref:PD-(D/E)XK nuclease family protein n=1 Tax=Flavobacterium terrisoli TaxID=3242195 RepID=UPI002542EE99|nr:PD-(D/E)XK nuclease family protein [Flavobacterium buctense]